MQICRTDFNAPRCRCQFWLSDWTTALDCGIATHDVLLRPETTGRYCNISPQHRRFYFLSANRTSRTEQRRNLLGGCLSEPSTMAASRSLTVVNTTHVVSISEGPAPYKDYLGSKSGFALEIFHISYFHCMRSTKANCCWRLVTTGQCL